MFYFSLFYIISFGLNDTAKIFTVMVLLKEQTADYMNPPPKKGHINLHYIIFTGILNESACLRNSSQVIKGEREMKNVYNITRLTL